MDMCIQYIRRTESSGSQHLVVQREANISKKYTVFISGLKSKPSMKSTEVGGKARLIPQP